MEPIQPSPSSKKLLITIIVIIDIIAISLIVYALTKNKNAPPAKNPTTHTDQTTDQTDTKSEPVVTARNFLIALKEKDGAPAIYTSHPTKGVRFSPYVNVNKDDLVFPAAEMDDLFTDPKIYTWGVYDGSGEPIKLTFEDYLAKFIYDKDYIHADKVSVQKISSRGNMINNIAEFYPGADYVEFYMHGRTEPYNAETGWGGMDWSSVYVILEHTGDTYRVIGVAHDQWTI